MARPKRPILSELLDRPTSLKVIKICSTVAAPRYSGLESPKHRDVCLDWAVNISAPVGGGLRETFRLPSWTLMRGVVRVRCVSLLHFHPRVFCVPQLFFLSCRSCCQDVLESRKEGHSN
jgi:hypothetical protein